MTKRELSLVTAIPFIAKYEKLFLFAFVGFLNTGVDFVVFFTLLKVLNRGLLFANCVAFSCAVCLSYALNRNVTFTGYTKRQKNTLANLSVYLCVALLALGGSSCALLLLARHGSPVTGKLVGTVVSFVVNYAGTKTLVFRDRRGQESEKGSRKGEKGSGEKGSGPICN